jgi:hypothetical protein
MTGYLDPPQPAGAAGWAGLLVKCLRNTHTPL